MASGVNPGKIRSACDTCHRLKVKCSGHVPCQGCLNSGSSCFYSYSGRLGRPRGTKNRRPPGNEDTNMGSAPDSEKEPSSRHDSPSRPSDQYRTHPSGQQQQPSVHQIPDDFGSSDTLGSSALFDSILDEAASGSAFTFNDSRQRRGWDGRGLDFTDFLMNDDLPGELGSSSKDSFNVPDISIDDILPRSYNTTIPTPSSSRASDSEGHMNPYLKRVADFDEDPLFSPTRMTLGSCTCLQQNAELLCSFKNANGEEGKSAQGVDTVLLNTQEALKLWQNLIQCRYCAYDNDQEVLLLALMTTRIVLLRLQQLLPSWSLQASGRNGSRDDRQSSQQQQRQQEADNWCPSNSTRVTVGSYEVMGNERMLVLQVVLLITVRKIKSVMTRFKEILDRKKKTLEIASDSLPRNIKQGEIELDHATSNLRHVQQMLQSLGSLLQTLERALERDQFNRYA